MSPCGLDHTRFSTDDTVKQYHYPPERQEHYDLHGRISCRLAHLVGLCARWDGDKGILLAEGHVTSGEGTGLKLDDKAVHRINRWSRHAGGLRLGREPRALPRVAYVLIPPEP